MVEAGQKAPAMQTVAQKLSLFPSSCEEVGVLNVFNNNSFPPGPTLNLGTTYHDVVFLCPSLVSSLLLKPIKCQNYVANEAKYIGLWHVHTPPGP